MGMLYSASKEVIHTVYRKAPLQSVHQLTEEPVLLGGGGWFLRVYLEQPALSQPEMHHAGLYVSSLLLGLRRVPGHLSVQLGFGQGSTGTLQWTCLNS